MEFISKRFFYILATLLFVVSLYFSYLSVAVERFSYFGYGSGEPNFENWITIFFCILLPTLLMPINNSRVSCFVNSIIFYTIYIPAILIINDQGINYSYEAVPLSFFLMAAMLVNIFTSYIPVINIKRIRTLNSIVLSKVTVFISILFIVLILIKVGAHFSFVGLLDVYDKRSAISEEGLGLYGYLVSWLINVLLPIVVSIGIVKKYKVLIWFGIFSYTLLFLCMGAKMYLFSFGYFFIAWVFYKSLRYGSVTIPILFSLILLLPFIMIGPYFSDIKYVYEGVVSFRVFLVQGLSPLVYSDYFIGNIYTYFSHVSIVNQFVDYPFELSIPSLLDAHYGYGTFNSPYFMSDGIVGAGYLGIIFMSFIFSFFIYCLDCSSERHDNLFRLLIVSVFVVSLANASLATSLVSFGGIFIFIFFITFDSSELNDNLKV